MKCPFCENLESKVLETRTSDEGTSIRRRRECLECKKRFTTYEKLERFPIMVVKKDGNREVFDRDKILRGILKSTEKRPVSTDEIEMAVENIEKKVQNLMKKEVLSNDIGELVMQELKELDDVSYVRFASVYREFKDLESFLNELEEIIKSKNEGSI